MTAELNVLFLMHQNIAKLPMAGFICVNTFVSLMACKTRSWAAPTKSINSEIVFFSKVQLALIYATYNN